MSAATPSPTLESAAATAPALATPQKRGVSWGSLSGLLPDRARLEVGTRFRALGGDFGRWSRLDRELIVEALTATEDWYEYEHPARGKERTALRDVRRILETELWP